VTLPAADTRFVPPRFFGGDCAPTVEFGRQACDECLAQDPEANVHCHSALAFSEAKTRGRTPIVVARWAENRILSFGVMLDRPLRISLAPGLRVDLRSHKLLESVVVGDRSHESLAALAEAIWKLLNSGETDSLLVEDLEVDSPLWKALTARNTYGVRAFLPTPPQPHWSIRLPERPEDYWNQFHGRTLSKLRQKARKMGALRCYRTAEEVEEFLGIASQIGNRTWQARRLGTRVTDAPDELGYWKAVARRGAMRSYVLEHEQRPAAFALASQWKGWLYYHEIGYDQALGGYSPGTVLLFRILQDLIERDCPRIFDFGFGDADYKRIFCNHQVASSSLVLVRGALLPLSLMWADRLRGDGARACRAALRRLGLHTRFRQRYRKGVEPPSM
jgi:hypothetical protein